MRKLTYLITLAAVLLISACSGGEGFVSDNPPLLGPDDPGANIPVSAVAVLASSPTMPSDAGQTTTISAIVRDTNNVAVQGVTVIMSTDSGTLTVADPVTDPSGVVTATLNGGGDPTNRAITVTADANGILGTVTVNVIGTAISISGPAALAQGFTAPYTIILTDAAGSGLAGQTVDVTSANGNTLSAASLTTDVSGQAQVDVTAAAAGADTLTATALGIPGSTLLSVSDDSFAFTAPAPDSEIVLGVNQAVSLTWAIGGVPQANQVISFSSTRGTLSPGSTATTNAQGVATVNISSTNAGPALITATNAALTSTGVQVEFVADTPSAIDVQASPFTIGPGEQSAVTATVRDPQNNLVKNAIVDFTLTDVTGGFLSVASGTTNSQGVANTFYTASSTTSANNGVTVAATVQGTAVTGSVSLTVAQREVFISLGTGNTVSEPDTATYLKEYVVFVTDSQGNGVPNVEVQVGILSERYSKGFWSNTVSLLVPWVQVPSTIPPCLDEDQNRNGVLDLLPAPGEDNNLSGRIEAGNVATVVPRTPSSVGAFITNNAGSGLVDVFYPQEFVGWVEVTLEATTSVQGTEFAKSSTFVLVGSALDFDDKAEAPPGQFSPFGIGTSCLDTN